MICHVLLIFFVLSTAAVIGGGVTAPPYVPTDVFLFNCGKPSDNNEDSGRKWSMENRTTFSSNPADASFTSKAGSYQDSGVPQVPYMTARIFRSNFTYSFPVTPGQKFIRLYFYPANYGSEFDAVNSFFSVTVNGFTLLKNFSAYLTVKVSIPEQGYLIKEFIAPVDRTLNLTFTPSPSSLAFVNGIEIVSMPDQFYIKGGFDDKITNVVDGGSNDLYTINNTTALETVSRVNVGGQMVSEVGDTGMFRRWLDETDFILGINSGNAPISSPDIKINYTEKTPAYVAPNSVYATCRIMGNFHQTNINLNFNLTWLFPVDDGFTYLVRLHFCEIDPNINGPSQRVFSIYIGNQRVVIVMDVFLLSGASRTPMYLDFSLYVTSGPLRLDLYPFTEGFDLKNTDALLNGVEILKLSNSNGNLAGPNPNPRVSTYSTQNRVKPSTRNGNFKKVKIGIALAFGILGLVAIGLIIFKVMSLGLQRRKTSHHRDSIKSLLQLKQYSYAEVKKITKSFSHTVGKGGFGTVYGGNLSDGRKVAVKILKDIKSSGEDFINEVASMGQTSHINIVSLLGFCYEGSKRAIVYEFLENGSLDQFISSKKSLKLHVNTLYGIALGVARGLEYLHHGCKTRIVHFDIKPQNVLLDDNLCPKVSDFGLARLCHKRESILSLLDTRGTIGYIAPEVFSRVYGRVSHKSDVYSYGMLVLEMIGERNKETATSNSSSAYFPDWIYEGLENGDHTYKYGDEITIEEKEIAKKMILVGLWCIQPCPSDRPRMNRVVEMMEGSLDVLDVPPKPSFQISSMPLPESSSLSEEDSNHTEV